MRSIRSSVTTVLDEVSENGACDFAKEVADALPTVVTCDLLGVPHADRGRIAALSRSAVPLGDPEFGGLDASFRSVGELIEYGIELRRDRLRAPKDDLLSVLATKEVDGQRLGASDVGTFFELLLTAGIETTGAAIAHGLIALTDHPEQSAAWRSDFADPGPVGSRRDPPLVDAGRSFQEDRFVRHAGRGVEIAEGDKVLIFFNSANRDETVFTDPHSSTSDERRTLT